MRLRIRLIAGFVIVHLLLSVVAGLVAWTWLDASRRAAAEASARSVGSVIAGGGFSLSPRVLERMRTLTGYEFRVLTAPEAVRPGTVQVGEGAFTVEIAYRNEAWHRESQQVVWATFLLFLGGSVVFTLVAVVVGRQIARPIEQLAASARAIGAGTWETAVPSVGTGEVAGLARDLEGMRERLLQLDQAHRQAERLATLGTFTATIAHEVRNPLSAVRLTVQLLARKHPDDQSLVLIGEEIERLDLIVDELLAYARGMAIHPEVVVLDQVAATALRLLRRQAEHAAVTVTLAGPGGKVRADPNRLRQLLINLLLNAIQAAQRGGGNVTISVLADGFSVLDDGPGVPPEQVPHLFEAFRTTRPDGTGLGLHLARSIAQAHGAELRHESRAPGACFVLSGLTRA
jgi:two-component system sensor histidine kinase AtoS